MLASWREIKYGFFCLHTAWDRCVLSCSQSSRTVPASIMIKDRNVGIGVDVHVYRITNGLKWQYGCGSHWHPCNFRPLESSHATQHHSPLTHPAAPSSPTADFSMRCTTSSSSTVRCWLTAYLQHVDWHRQSFIFTAPRHLLLLMKTACYVWAGGIREGVRRRDTPM